MNRTEPYGSGILKSVSEPNRTVRIGSDWTGFTVRTGLMNTPKDYQPKEPAKQIVYASLVVSQEIENQKSARTKEFNFKST